MSRDKRITSKIMSSIKSKGTKPEILLGKALWKNGLRYRKHYPIKGKPDFVLVAKRIAIFCDGDFWHGNNWKIRGMANFQEEIESYSQLWKDKILKNIERDKEVNAFLMSQNWKVFRFWESDILKDTDELVEEILNYISSRDLSQTNMILIEPIAKALN